MSTRKEGFLESRSNHPKYIIRYTCSVDGGGAFGVKGIRGQTDFQVTWAFGR